MDEGNLLFAIVFFCNPFKLTDTVYKLKVRWISQLFLPCICNAFLADFRVFQRILTHKGYKNNRTKKLENGFLMRFFFGVPKGIRTPDLSLRRRTLYPTELLAHNITIVYDGLRFVKKLGNFLILLNIQKNLK